MFLEIYLKNYKVIAVCKCMLLKVKIPIRFYCMKIFKFYKQYFVTNYIYTVDMHHHKHVNFCITVP